MQTDVERERWLGHRLPSPEERRIVVLTGARQTGKTTLARRVYSTLPYYNLDDLGLRSQLAALRAPGWARTVGPAVLDEVQKEPGLFEKVKYAFDDGALDFSVLLGSSRILLLSRVRETLAGRAFLYDLWPLMLSELITPAGEPLPRPLFDRLVSPGAEIDAVLAAEKEILLGESGETRRAAVDHLLRWGGMPELLRLRDEDRIEWLRSYRQAFLERDLADLARLRDLEPFRGFQQLAMLRSGRLLSYADLGRDAGIGATTARRYLQYFDLSYQTLLLPPYASNPTTALVKSPKLYWLDLGLLRQSTGQTELLTGEHFETFVVAECHKWVSSAGLDTRLSFYRKHSGLEVDLLATTAGHSLGIEIKLRERARPEDARALAGVARELGDRWRGGLVVSRDPHLRPLLPEHSIWAVPVDRLF